MSIREDAYLAFVRQNTRALWTAYNNLKGAGQGQWNGLDYGTTLQAELPVDAEFTAAEVGAVVFDTVNAIATLMGQGHATNVSKLL